MKFIKSQVLPVLVEMEKIAGGSVRPILECAFLKGNSVMATNLETIVEYKGGIQINKPCAVEVKRLLKIARATSAEEIDIKLKKQANPGSGELSVGRFTLATLDPEERPVMVHAGGKSYKLKERDIEVFRRLVHATSDDINKKILNFIKIDADAKKAVATDGHRMCLETVHYRGPSIFIDRSFVAAQKRLEKAGFQIEHIKVGEHQTTVKMTREKEVVLWTTRQPEGSFPDYQRVIPETVIGRINVPDNLLALLEEPAKAIFDDKYCGVTFTIDKKGAVSMKAKNPGVGEWSASPDMKAKKVAKKKGASLVGKFSLNNRYLMDALKINGVTEMGVNEPASPVTMYRDGEMIAIVMPMAL